MHHSLRLIAALALLLPLAAQAATRVDERAPLGAGGRVEVSNIAGKVSVRGWDRNEVALSGSMADGLTLKQDRSANRVRWEVVYGPDEWIGTEVVFELSQEDDFTIVMFAHTGWREAVPFMNHCSTKWATFLMSLKQLVETGTGAPAPDDVRVSDWH